MNFNDALSVLKCEGKFPNSKKVGFVKELSMDFPEEELLIDEPKENI